MSDIVERLREQVRSDHSRGCMGRCYSCECGYDLQTEGLLEMAAAEIERLRIWEQIADSAREDALRARDKLTEAAAFLDRTASRLRADDISWGGIRDTAADCRAMAAKLRGE
jgi:hypothetical protein